MRAKTLKTFHLSLLFIGSVFIAAFAFSTTSQAAIITGLSTTGVTNAYDVAYYYWRDYRPGWRRGWGWGRVCETRCNRGRCVRVCG